MTEALALKYRPRSFDDLVGQRAVQIVLRQMVASMQVPQALLFNGSRGTGKTTTGRILAAALNCDSEAAAAPCGHCPSCKAIFSGTSLDLVEIDAASNGLVDDIRQLRTQVLYAVGGRYRVVMLDEAHSMSRAAFDALLKTLEEPPPGTVFIMLTTEPARIPDTVLSRCMPFTFQRIPVVDTAARLAHICQVEDITCEPALLTLLAERADGSMRDAVMALDQISRVGVSTVDAYTVLTGEPDCGPALLAALRVGNFAVTYPMLADLLARTGDAASITAALSHTIADILTLGAGGTINRQGNALAVRQKLATTLPVGTVLAAARVLWDLKTKMRAGDDPRADLELAAAMLTEILADKPEPAVAASARKLSLADMAAMRRNS